MIPRRPQVPLNCGEGAEFPSFGEKTRLKGCFAFSREYFQTGFFEKPFSLTPLLVKGNLEYVIFFL